MVTDKDLLLKILANEDKALEAANQALKILKAMQKALEEREEEECLQKNK